MGILTLELEMETDEMKLGATTHKFRKLRKTRGIWESSAGKEWRYLENLRLLVNLANMMSLMNKVRDQYLDLIFSNTHNNQ